MKEETKGYSAALSAFVFWGGFPLYWKLLETIPPFETLMHRIIWTVPICMVIIFATGRLSRLVETFTNIKLLSLMVICSILIATNWGVFIWSVTSGQVLEASLGYFMSPLVNVLCGMTFFKEKLSRLQTIAVILAGIGVLLAMIIQGTLPFIALILSVSFGIYGAIRKSMPTGSVSGLAAETIIIAPFALGYLVWLEMQGNGFFFHGPFDIHLILMCAGMVTAFPLILYVEGAKRLTMTAMGMMFYITPSLVFIQSTLLFNEEITIAKAVLFGCIWTSLALYSYDLMTYKRKLKKPARP